MTRKGILAYLKGFSFSFLEYRFFCLFFFFVLQILILIKFSTTAATHQEIRSSPLKQSNVLLL